MSSTDLINNFMTGMAFGMLTSQSRWGYCTPVLNPVMSYPMGGVRSWGGYNPFGVSLLASPIMNYRLSSYSNQYSSLNFNTVPMTLNTTYNSSLLSYSAPYSSLNFSNFVPKFNLTNLNLPVPKLNNWNNITYNSKLVVGDTFTRTSNLNASYSNQKIGGKPSSYDSLINKYAKEYGVDPNLVKAVMKRESQFNPKACSPAGARGLMQLMPATARELGVTDINDPEQNIKAGVKYLKKCLDARGGNVELALASYNAGPNNSAVKAGRIPQNGETPNYVNAVMKYYNEYKASA